MNRIVKVVHPKVILSTIKQIDAKAIADTEKKGGFAAQLPRVWVILSIACVSLILVHYLKYDSVFFSVVRMLELLFDVPRNHWVNAINNHMFGELFTQLWWGSVNLIALLVLPMLVIKFWLKEKIADYGWQAGDIATHWLDYVVLATPIVIFAIIASYNTEFSSFYPFYKHADRSWLDFFMWQAIYILQFIAIEFFFRGLLVNGLRLPFGSLSVAIMSLPYLMLHFPKLWPEAMGAILFGFFLGILALKSRSIWGGVAVHVAIAFTMDLSALIQTNRLPTQWWPF